MNKISLALFFSLSIIIFASSAEDAFAAAVRSGFDSNTLAANDDDSVGPVNLGFSANDGKIKFFSVETDEIFVNNNGNISFESAISVFNPSGLSFANTPIVAPFFADVDTRINGMEVTYGPGTINGFDAFGVNWISVDCKNDQVPEEDPNLLNSFQLILIERDDTGLGNFDIEFNYDAIKWEAGDASMGDDTCLGGDSARVGYSDGTAENSFEFAGSNVNGALLDDGPPSTSLIQNSLNSNVLGRYIIPVRVNEQGLGIPNPNPSSMIVGGQVIPTDTVALLLAESSANSFWLLPMIAGAAGAGSYLTRNIWNKFRK